MSAGIVAEDMRIDEVMVLIHYRPAMPFGNRKKYYKGSFQVSFVTVKKYHSSENQKFNNLGFFQSLKLRNSMGNSPLTSLRLNFTPNTLGC